MPSANSSAGAWIARPVAPPPATRVNPALAGADEEAGEAMKNLEGFLLGKRLGTSAHTQTYAAIREIDGHEVVLKSTRGSERAPRFTAEHEFRALTAVQGKGIAEALGVLARNPPVLVQSRAPGIPLEEWVGAIRPEVVAVLQVAIGIAAALEHVHKARWIHCRLTPRDVIVDSESLDTCLIDFALARPIGGHLSVGDATNDIRSLRYMAPEQGGRMNRGVDARSDLYALGTLLFFAFTGEPPFDFSDPLALIHAHMAREPRSARELRTDLPQAVARLISKLLEKEPEDRYQSAQAVLADLRRCRDQLTERGQIDAQLPLGTSEAPDRPRFSSKLYDRDAQIGRLRALYARAAAGAGQVVMIAGEPGTGKSALADALRPQIADSGGYMAVGKFDLSHDRPFGAWAAALGTFVQQLLVESDERLAYWRGSLRSGLGNVAHALVDLVPDLTFVVGDVPPVPKLPPRETQARLALAMRRFVEACARGEHPLVIFLDDLQWADAASRGLLEELAAAAGGVHLLIIGAYRGNEVGPEHPLAHTFEQLTARQADVEALDLLPLSSAATTEMLAEVLERPVEAVLDLAALIERKTGNAPLFVRQFVGHIHAKGWLRYVPGAGWDCDLDEVASATIPDGVAGIMAAKLDRLGPDACAAIELASCVGDEFDLELLCELTTIERELLERGLYALCDLGLIAPCPSGFRFVHDRIREAARGLLSEERQARLHHETARLLLQRIAPAERPRRILEIAEHVRAGITHLSDAERLPALRVEIEAGKHALAIGAPESAETFLAVGRYLLRPEDWHSAPALGFDLLYCSLESAFLRGDSSGALEMADALDRQSLSTLERAQVAAKRIQVFALTRSPLECARYALDVLREFGVRLPLRPTDLRVYLSLRLLQWRLRGDRLERTLRPMARPDPAQLAPIIVIGAAVAPMVRVSQGLVALVICWVVDSNLRHGSLGGGPYALSGAATFVQRIVGDSRDAERFERAALAHQARSPDPLSAPKTDVTIFGSVRPWRMERREAVAPLEGVAEALSEIGDVEYHCYCRFLKTFLSGLAGDSVRDSIEHLRELRDFVKRSGHLYAEPELCLRPYQLLRARDADVEGEIAASEREITLHDGSAEPYVRTLWLLVLCVHRRFDLAIEQAERMGDRLFDIVPFVHIADHTFYRGLAAAALSVAGGQHAGRNRRILRRSLRRLRRWARMGPDFQHMVWMLEGERARLAGSELRARTLYKRAAARARDQGFVHHAALARERMARLLTGMRRETEATAALAQAIALYREWGAQAKEAELRAEYEEMCAAR